MEQKYKLDVVALYMGSGQRHHQYCPFTKSPIVFCYRCLFSADDIASVNLCLKSPPFVNYCT